MPNSVKEVLNSALTNVRGKTYLVNDVLTLRGYTAASAAVGPGDTLADIDRWLTNRTKIGAVSGTGWSTDENDYPGGLKFTNEAGKLHHGTGTVYALRSARVVTANSGAVAAVAGATGTCAGYSVKAENKEILYNPTGEIWTKIPAFESIATADAESTTVTYTFQNNPNYIVLRRVDSATGSMTIYVSPDLYECSKGITCVDGYVDSLGRVFTLDAANNALAYVHNIYNTPVSEPILLNGTALTGCTYASFSEVAAQNIVYFTAGSVVFELVSATPTDEAQIFQVPALSMGSLYIDKNVMELNGLGFVPDKVLVTFRGESQTNVQASTMILTTKGDIVSNTAAQANLLGLSHRKLLNEASPFIVKTVTTDVNTTKHSGFISGDGFVLNLTIDYIGSICDYVAFGSAAGNDPYLS